MHMQGLHPTPSKTKVIMDAPSPKSVTELKSFLGLLNYYCKFLPNLSSTLHPLYCLLQKSSSWSWGPREEDIPDEKFGQKLYLVVWTGW